MLDGREILLSIKDGLFEIGWSDPVGDLLASLSRLLRWNPFDKAGVCGVLLMNA